MWSYVSWSILGFENPLSVSIHSFVIGRAREFQSSRLRNIISIDLERSGIMRIEEQEANSQMSIFVLFLASTTLIKMWLQRTRIY